MKAKSIEIGFLVFLVCAIVSGSAADEPQKKVMNFLAVMDLNCGTALSKENCTALTNVVIDELVKMKKYTVIDRANRDKILSEAGFQQTGCVDDSCAIEMGRQLGAGKLVVGSISMIGKTYVVNLQLLNVETAAVETSSKEMCKKCESDDLISVVINVTRKLMDVEPEPSTPQRPSPKVPGATPVTPTSDMVLVPAGKFIMGCTEVPVPEGQYLSECLPADSPQHKVYLDAYYIDKFEVTVAQYTACVKAGKCTAAETGRSCNFGNSERNNHPINCVDWFQSKAYCEYTGKRLPTEAEWEKAARGTDGRRYPWGNIAADCNYAVTWEDEKSGCGKESTWPVGSKPYGASPYGAMDMAGNVCEWTADWYDENYYKISPGSNPKGPDSGVEYRVRRGGAWKISGMYEPSDYVFSMSSTARDGLGPALANIESGFRCAKSK